MKEGKKPKFVLGVAEAKLGNAISDGLSVPCACNEFTGELLRGVRAHAGHLTKVHTIEAASTMCLLYLFDMGAINGDSACHNAHGSLPCRTQLFPSTRRPIGALVAACLSRYYRLDHRPWVLH